jgi:hypothetical protein
MKTPNKHGRYYVCSSVLAALVAFRAAADEAPSTANSPAVPEKTCTGTVLSLDNNEHVLYLRGWLSQRKAFNLGDSCANFQQGSESLPVNSLQPGQKVTVSYQDRHGVLIADRLQDVPMRLEGMVESIDPTNHILFIHQGVMHTKLTLADGCPVRLRGGIAGSLADIKAGNYVTVTYLTPGDVKTTRQIAQTSVAFTGELTGIDLENRTVKARAVFGSKEFHLSDHCAVVINGQPNGKLTDLRPEERLVFNYDTIDGVNVVDRIAPADQVQGHMATSTPDQGY